MRTNPFSTKRGTSPDAYVEHVIDAVNDLDNVLYEVANEAPIATRFWQNHVIDHIHNYENGKPKQHPVGITAFDFATGQEGSNQYLFASNADWISLNGQNGTYTSDVPDASTAKVSILDSDHTWGFSPPGANNSAWVWKSLTRGHNPIYLDAFPGSVVSVDTNLRAAMGKARTLANRIDLQHMAPSDSLSSTGYVLANQDVEYLVYQPEPSPAPIVTHNLPIKLINFEWTNPASGLATSGQINTTAGDNSFSPPIGYTEGSLLRLVIPTAVSRKTHGSAGTFDANLPLTGAPGIECRSGGISGNYQIVVTFADPVTQVNAAVTTGIGSVNGNPSINGADVTIDLVGVANAQTITITLHGTSNGANFTLAVPMSVLAGDTTANGMVNSSDVAQTRAASGQIVNDSNFRTDVTLNGSIDSSDVAFVLSYSGTALP